MEPSLQPPLGRFAKKNESDSVEKGNVLFGFGALLVVAEQSSAKPRASPTRKRNGSVDARNKNRPGCFFSIFNA